ncbi:hypothetical protein [Halodesulfovibrio sp.]|jgi:hypothetical protein|uniref:hypothetical protein n=1 Tax=Halodesulfovibrio sp. TaxID=1912772 RepID=UPI0025DE47DE|nr:hypothetical protein [Halodesulfovibrio sp.]MCT4627426.1 hypothetical protein [Halodesulfovibrio sp.]
MMTRADKFVLLSVAGILLLLVGVPALGDMFMQATQRHGYLMSFAKFAVLATFGECLALRIVSGKYWKKGFGVLPKMIVWGLLGVVIKAAFGIFIAGVPTLFVSLGLAELTHSGSFAAKAVIACSISVCLNTIFAPVFMTMHKITDGHISDNAGRLSSLLIPIDMKKQFNAINWDIQWGFVFKKTIPLFWIPAHTVTFLLPHDFRILFAAALGIVLGVILAFANLQRAR